MPIFGGESVEDAIKEDLVHVVQKSISLALYRHAGLRLQPEHIGVKIPISGVTRVRTASVTVNAVSHVSDLYTIPQQVELAIPVDVMFMLTKIVNIN